ncbi:hypothetical protein QFZ76_007611 [Streptomyces sp. V4I2]|nr:hypothetical protein [Streptomyces sp. V4I2]
MRNSRVSVSWRHRAAAADSVHVDAPGAGQGLGRALDRVQVDPVDGLLDGPQVRGADDLHDPFEVVLGGDLRADLGAAPVGDLAAAAFLGQLDQQVLVRIQADGPAEPGHRRLGGSGAAAQLGGRAVRDGGRILQDQLADLPQGAGQPRQLGTDESGDVRRGHAKNVSATVQGAD